MLRHIALTIIAIVFFCTGLVMYYKFRGTSNDGGLMLGNILMRCGMVLGVISLSLNQVQEFFQKYPPWLVGSVTLTVIVVIIRPQAIIIVGPLILIVGALQFWGWLMTPPAKRKPKK